jgi:YD repeat-containing protein
MNFGLRIADFGFFFVYMAHKLNKSGSMLPALIFALILVGGARSLQAQQSSVTRYVYDQTGRLIAVISPTGEASVFDYDPAGNFTAVRRLTSNDLALFGFTPLAGVPGDQVTFYGTGFGAGVNSVSFNGATAQIVSVGAAAVVAAVPQGATTGLVSIATSRGTVTTSTPFVVEGVRVSPASVRIQPGQIVQFTATVSVPGTDQSIFWSVNGSVGGNATVGTITAGGLYSPPSQPMLLVTVRATSVAVPALFGEAQVTVLDPTKLLTPIAAFVSVQHGIPGGLGTAFSAGVSVQRGIPGGLGTAFSAGVSMTTGPYVSRVSPSQVTKGTTVTMTISGANLSGATALRFIDAIGNIDSSIVASNLTVNANGTSLTATVNVGGSAATGPRIVVVSTTVSSSLTVSVGSNTFVVQ